MHAGVIDQRVLGYLGRGLSLELSAVQLYSTQARVAENWGLKQAADRFRHEVEEETGHAERIIARMIALGVAPGASQLRPVKLGPDLVSLLKYDREFEMELVQLYQDAVSYCMRSGHKDDRVFFHTLLEEEQKHAAELSEWIASLDEVSTVSGRLAAQRDRGAAAW